MNLRQVVAVLILSLLVACKGAPMPTSTPQLPPPPPTGIPSAISPTESTQPPSLPAQTEDATVAPTRPEAAGDDSVYLPAISAGSAPPTAPATMVPTPALGLTPPGPPLPALDFAELRNDLNAQGQQLGFVKIGFHVTFLEQKGLLDNWMQQLDAAGVPFFLKTVDNAEPLYKAQQLREVSGVPHTLVFRATGGVPEYDLPPQEAARIHWEYHKSVFPPELDKDVVWVETINELDKNRSEWIAAFALESARLAMADGFKWAAFGWSAGEPEPEDWEAPLMLEFLRLAGANPDRLAIALHEGSATPVDIRFEYPYRTGRFLKLFEIADKHGIRRPTVLITEFGWAYDDIPDLEVAMEHIAWASRLFAPFPEVKGAAIWNLGTGCCFGDVSLQVRELIDPLTLYALSTYFSIPGPGKSAGTDPSLYE